MTAKRYLGAIDRAVARAERLISDLLEASAIENGKLSLTPSQVNAASIVRQAAAEHELARQGDRRHDHGARARRAASSSTPIATACSRCSQT